MLTIKRFNGEKTNFNQYPVDSKKTLLENFQNIKENIDESLCFREGCKSGVCGSCAVIINDKEVLACKTRVKDNDIVEPLKNSEVIKDLIVDNSHEEKLLKKAKTYLENYSNETVTSSEVKDIETQSSCILCQSCYSSCPVYTVNENFTGPYALSRSLRYIQDKKEKNTDIKLAMVQDNGIWDCTLCGNCTIVCPQGIDPKNDIMQLRMKSVQNGFEDKNLQQNSFNINLGFDPNSF